MFWLFYVRKNCIFATLFCPCLVQAALRYFLTFLFDLVCCLAMNAHSSVIRRLLYCDYSDKL